MTSNSKKFPAFLMIWIVFTLFLKYVLQFLPGIGINSLTDQYHFSAEGIGFLAASYFYPYLLLQIPAGIIIDRFRVSYITTIALAFCAAGSILFAFGANLSTLIIARLLMGVGVAFFTVAYMRAASIYFSLRWFSRLSGFFGLACMGGAGVTVLVLGWVYATFGWHVLLKAIALFSVALVLLGFYFIKQESFHLKQIEQATDKKPFDLKNILLSVWNILKQKNNILLLLYNGLAFAPIAVFGGLWGKRYFTSTFHISAEQAEIIISCLFFSYAIGGAILCSIFNTLKQQKWFMVLGICVSLIFFIIMVRVIPTTTGFVGLLILMIIIGFFASGFLASYTLTKAVNSATHIATAIAIVNMGDPIFGGMAEPLMGKIIDSHHGTFLASMNVLIVYWVAAIIIGLMVSIKNVKED